MGRAVQELREHEAGQYNAGSGTTPTILGEGRYVTITDNAEPYMHVVVYRTDYSLKEGVDRVVCEMPVFQYAKGGALDNSCSDPGSRSSLRTTTAINSTLIPWRLRTANRALNASTSIPTEEDARRSG